MGMEPTLETVIGTATASGGSRDGTAAGVGELSLEMRERISERLSRLDNLYFPRALQATAATPSQRCSLLLDLLSRDVAVFLERYGTHLTSNELQQFDVLKSDYEINWHINQLRSMMTPSSEELRSRSITVKNRRRAYLNKLISDGQYFSEDAMRAREPYLHHEYLGRFQDPTGRSMARPGERWSETLMRRSEEAFLVAEIRREQQRLGVAEKDWVGNEINHQQEEEEDEETEEEEGEEEEDEQEGSRDQQDREEEIEGEEEQEQEGPRDQHDREAMHSLAAADTAHSVGPTQAVSLSAIEMQDQMDQFTYLMQQKFLAGEDHKHLDYTKIDEDESLDDHWMREANHDAEDKYFSED